MDLFAMPRVLSDGAMGTLIAERGGDAAIPERLNFLRPDLIIGIHADYLAAGAMVVTANTFGLHPVKLARANLSGDAEALTAAGVTAARAAVERCGHPAWVAADLGPTGELLSPFGSLDFDDAVAGYAAIARAARNAGADVGLIETFSDIGEARAALLGSRSAGLPAIVSYTFEGNRMLMGGTPQAAALAAQAAGARAVGVNCSQGPEAMTGILTAMAGMISLPLWVQPNAGIPQVVNGRTVFPYTPEEMIPAMQQLLDAGAWGIGGCCGTTPRHIATFAPLLQGCPPPSPHGTGVPYVSSQRSALPLDDAETKAEDVPADLDELPDALSEVLRIDLGGMNPGEIAAFLCEAQQITSKPMLFRVRDDAQADAALRYYHGSTRAEGA